MSSTNWTEEDLARLERAIASGHLSVRYGDQSVNYQSIDAMLKVRDMMRRALGVAAATKERRRIARYGKGLG
jgi:hypothetical protein